MDEEEQVDKLDAVVLRKDWKVAISLIQSTPSPFPFNMSTSDTDHRTTSWLIRAAELLNVDPSWVEEEEEREKTSFKDDDIYVGAQRDFQTLSQAEKEENRFVMRFIRLMLERWHEYIKSFKDDVKRHLIRSTHRSSIRMFPLWKVIHEFCELGQLSEVNFVDDVLFGERDSSDMAWMLTISDSRPPLPFVILQWLFDKLDTDRIDSLLLSHRTFHQESSLHLALSRRITCRRLRLYLGGNNPDSLLLSTNSDGMTPLMTFCKFALDRDRCSFDDSDDDDEIDNDFSIDSFILRALEACRNVLRAIATSRDGSEDQKEISLIQLIARKAHVVPLELLDFVLENDEESLLDQEDEAGRLPLHMACMASGETDHLTANLLFLQVKNPSANQVVCQSNGRLPLHYALEAGRAKHVVDLMVNYHPLSVQAIDPVTGLMPFLLAALKGNVESVYSILRVDPAALAKLL